MLGRIQQDSKLENLHTSQLLSQCTTSTKDVLALNKLDACAAQADQHRTKTGYIGTLRADTIISDNTIVVENLPVPRLFRVMDTIAIDTLGSITGNGLLSITWTLEQAYVITNNGFTWTSLLTTPYSSGPITTFTPYPAPQSNLLTEYLVWLESAFQNTGLQSQYGFRVLGPRFAGARIDYEFEMAVNATMPHNSPQPNDMPYVDNFVLAIRRQDDQGGNNVYLYVLNDALNGNNNEQHIYYTTTGVLNPGMPDSAGFFTNYSLVVGLVSVDNYYGRFEQRYVLLRDS